ncbi:TPA: hypothetical protein VAH73_002237 [Legionella pneumophila]|nr:hypothetical protein [Legionella pneumophila]
MEIIDLETKWFYRLVKVMHIFFLTASLIGVLCMGWGLKPYHYVNNNESYLICAYGLHSFKNTNLDLYSDSKKFDIYSDERARNICSQDANKHYENKTTNYQVSKDQITPALARAELKRREILRQHSQTDHYEISIKYDEAGSWAVATKIWFFGSLIIFLIFNVIKQSPLYIVYGKKFTLSW